MTFSNDIDNVRNFMSPVLRLKLKHTIAAACLLFGLVAPDVLAVTASFDGRISAPNVSAFLKKYSAQQVETLEIMSQGGELVPALELAKWVEDNHLAVVVRRLCASACANFVFAAGRTKVIYAPGLVLYHGSAESKKVRDMLDEYERLAAALKAGTIAEGSPEALRVQSEQKKHEFMKSFTITNGMVRLMDDRAQPRRQEPEGQAQPAVGRGPQDQEALRLGG